MGGVIARPRCPNGPSSAGRATPGRSRPLADREHEIHHWGAGRGELSPTLGTYFRQKARCGAMSSSSISGKGPFGNLSLSHSPQGLQAVPPQPSQRPHADFCAVAVDHFMQGPLSGEGAGTYRYRIGSPPVTEVRRYGRRATSIAVANCSLQSTARLKIAEQTYAATPKLPPSSPTPCMPRRGIV